jgi:K+-sensing histidine kinase KdpD
MQRGDKASIDMPSIVTVAHELKAPLSLVRQIALARDYYSEEERERALRRIELISDRSLRLVTMLTKQQQQRSDFFDIEIFNFNWIVEEVAHEFYPILAELEQPIELRLKKRPLLTCGNKEIVQSIIAGMCDNALYYGNKDHPIIISTRETSSTARVAVDDIGPRSDPAQSFTPHRPQSSGLGLYIAEEFAKKIHSSIGRVRHHRGGMKFYLDIPLTRQLELFA